MSRGSPTGQGAAGEVDAGRGRAQWRGCHAGGARESLAEMVAVDELGGGGGGGLSGGGGAGEALPVAAAAELAGWGGDTEGRRRKEGAGARETEREERSERARGGNFA